MFKHGLKHTREYYMKFILFFIIVFFLITYASINKDTIFIQLKVVFSWVGFLFMSVVSNSIDVEVETDPVTNVETYKIEMMVFDQINQIRRESGLNDLVWDPMLGNLGRTHSVDMARYSYFNHTNFLGMDTNGRAKLLGLKTKREDRSTVYIGIGENIGYVPKGIVPDYGILLIEEDISAAVVLGWLLSEEHKENILDRDYVFTGVGVAYDGEGNYYITQNFQ